MTEIEKPQPDSNDQTPGMPRWLIGALLGIAIYLIVGFVLVQLDDPSLEDWMRNGRAHCGDLLDVTQFRKFKNWLFLRNIIRSFLNPVVFLGISDIHSRTFLEYFMGISVFAAGGAVFSSIHATKIRRLIIGIVIILTWILVVYVGAVLVSSVARYFECMATTDSLLNIA